MTGLADQDGRAQAIAERARNVVVDASAGTGKTRLIVERLVALVAPSSDEPAIAIDRIAAITFTRKAAGELRVRTRQRLLEQLAALDPTCRRADLLRDALAGLDTAQITTIHGFADHLLRAWPARTWLDPRYELDDDEARLHRACFEALVHAAETGTLAEQIGGSSVVDRADEATATILALERAGLLLRSREAEHWTYHGLDNLVAGFARHRDLAVDDPAACAFDRATFMQFAAEYLARIDGLSPASRGGRWLLESGAVIRQALAEPDPIEIFGALARRLTRGPSDKPTRKHDFLDDDAAWDVWRAFTLDTRKQPVRIGSLRDDLLRPLRCWLAIRLARLRPVVLHVYERVKASHQVVDHLDLLLRLRDLLRDDHQIRRHCQGRFDHLFVDELQDTDPVQAEIIALLCERATDAASGAPAVLAPGTLTVVGDPKQSIYRFRRADIATYHQLLELVERSPHRAVRLTSSFRSTPAVVDWLNRRFAEILGGPAPDPRARRVTGEVCHQPLSHGRASGAGPAVHAVPLELPAGELAANQRALEADAMARYVRWLVGVSDARICDPISDQPRRIGYGDIGVLAITTTTLRLLFDAFDRDSVPYAARGGTLFLDDPLHRQFLLGLCALADRDDGVARAALLRPPFFAVDLADLARSRDEPGDRATQARAIVRELRRRRFTRSPGATARALLEDTAIGRVVALGPNGQQRLRGLSELCHQVEARALEARLDFDATIEALRGWIDRPDALDRPLPVTGDTVRVMTVHQAKGLEFPVVVLWDSRARWTEQASHDAWTAARDGGGWELRLDSLSWEQPAGIGIAQHEHRMREAERVRLVYVAATRARDLLIIPRVGEPPDDHTIFHRLLGPRGSDPAVLDQERHSAQQHATWYDQAAPADATPAAVPPTPPPDEVELARAWATRARAASQPRLAPSAFTQAASPRSLWGKHGRHGTAFGQTVHLAIGRVLTAHQRPGEAVATAAAQCGLVAHLRAATEDVIRALDTLHALRISDHLYRLEYPIAGALDGDRLVAGYIDLVVQLADRTIVIDFKTDPPPASADQAPQTYRDQVCGYARALEQTSLRRPIQAGLLFTADGGIRWMT